MTRDEFIKALSDLNIYFTDQTLAKLETYYNLLVEENQKYNLTAITTKESAYLKHFYDSLTISKIIDLDTQKICDIGSGAGFPGLVLKIFYPDLDLTLIEANSKKCFFLNLVIQKLNLTKIKVINERAEIYSKTNREIYDIVTARAVAPLAHLLEYSIPAVKVNGYFIAMKGNVTEELENISNYYSCLNIQLIDQINFNLPQENSNRTLLKFQKLSPTPSKYPRKYSEIKKKNLK